MVILTIYSMGIIRYAMWWVTQLIFKIKKEKYLDYTSIIVINS